MKIHEIIQNPLTFVLFLHVVLRRSLIWGPSPYMYASITNMGSYFVLLSMVIILVEQKRGLEPYLESLSAPLRYILIAFLALLMLETAMILIWSHVEIFVRDICHFVLSSFEFLKTTNPRLRMVVPEVFITSIGISALTVAMTATSTGHRFQRKIEVLLSM